MAVISGKGGSMKKGASFVAEVRRWSFNPKADNQAYASSSTAGFKKRVAGVKDGSGTFEANWDSAVAPPQIVVVGDKVTLTLYVDSSDSYQVPAIIDDITTEVDIDGGGVVTYRASFSNDGSWTEPA